MLPPYSLRLNAGLSASFTRAFCAAANRLRLYQSNDPCS